MKLSARERAEVGRRLKQVRADRGKTQAEMATQLDCDRSYYARLENALTTVAVGRLFEIADRLEVDRDWLVWGSPSKQAVQAELYEAERINDERGLLIAEEGAEDMAGGAWRKRVAEAWRIAVDADMRAYVEKIAEHLGRDPADVVADLLSGGGHRGR